MAIDKDKRNDAEARRSAQDLMEKGYKVSKSPTGWRVVNRIGQVYRDALSDSGLIQLASQVVALPGPEEQPDGAEGTDSATPADQAQGGEESPEDGGEQPQEDPAKPMSTSEIPVFQSHPEFKAALAATAAPISVDASGSVVIGERTTDVVDLEAGANGMVKASDIPLFRLYPTFANALRDSGMEVTVTRTGDVIADGTTFKNGVPEE